MAQSTRGGGVLSPGHLLNNTYEIEELVGSGGAGEVYRARNTHSKRTVAIKVLLAEHAQDPAHLERMIREIVDVSHPAIVRYLDLHHTTEFNAASGGLYYLGMEFIDGPSLARMMRDGPVAPETLTKVAETILGGLEACHAGQIFHRDISPDNIILRGGDPAKATLIDFGIAKDVRPDAKTVVGKGFAGKYEYAAPEQLDGRSDNRSDLYSLGATLLAAARGHAPDLGDSLVDVLRIKHARADVSGLPEPLHGLLTALLEPRPDDRPATATAARTMLSGRTAPPPPPPPPEPRREPPREPAPKRPAPPPPPPKKKRGGLVLALLALAAALGAVWFVPPLHDAVFGPRLPLAQPYTMTMARTGDAATASGNAPSEEAAAALAQRIGEALGGADTAMTAAKGVPNEKWATMAETLARLVQQLEPGRAGIEDTRITLEGTAPTPDIAAQVERSARAEAARNGYEIATLALDIAPQDLPLESVEAITIAAGDCGPLSIDEPLSGRFAPGETIGIGGAMGAADSIAALRQALEGIADGRPLDLDAITTINPSVCRVRSMLPPVAEPQATLDYASGQSGAVVVDDFFAPDDVPLVDLVLPADVTGYLHAFAVDNEFNTLHLRPGPSREVHDVTQLGEVSGGQRTIRILHPAAAEWDWATPFVVFTEPYGDMRLYAVVTEDPLFDILRGNIEDTRDFVPDLAAALAEANVRFHAERALRVRVP